MGETSNLDLSSNILQGPLPIPPPSTYIYRVSNNSLNGGISELICNATTLYSLDLSYNNLSGGIPQCLSNFSESLTILNLQSNNFHGSIRQTFNKGSNLKVIDLSENQLEGMVPRSLANCTMLEFLNLGNNQIDDIFPFWLGIIPELKILLLRSNRFHGTIVGHWSASDFPKLRIIDLSYNGFVGGLPSTFFQNWNATRIRDVDQPIYLQTGTDYQAPNYYFVDNFTFSMTIRNKGLETFYVVILNVLAAIDLSSNKFNGEIPESVGKLEGLQMLNLSNNGLTSIIPSSLANLTDLQALDLSQNELSGEIPQQLKQLTFLSFLNVSHNHLIGPIPRGNQFGTFENSSFDGNLGLCGDPLSKKCGSFEAFPSPPPPPLPSEKENSNFPSKFDWIFMVTGYGSGLVFGLMLGYILTTSKHDWFVRTFALRRQKRRNKRGGKETEFHHPRLFKIVD